MKSIVVFGAHSDDQVLGVGGTIAKYAAEGYDVTTVIFSLGELTHPWLQRKHTAEMRVGESERAGKVLGSKKLLFLGLNEGKFPVEFEDRKVKILRLLKAKRPVKIFLHAPDDLHPDHRAVFDIVTNLVKEMRLETDLYSYDVWNLMNIKKQDWPKLYIDISDTFHQKMKALGEFQSQSVALTVLMGSTFLLAFFAGIHHNCRFAERFYKVPL
jgi:N-acetylglucosamine malate deacetylase 1